MSASYSAFFRSALAAAVCLALCTPSFAAPVSDVIDAHTAQGRTVFVVLTDAAAQGLENARAVAKQARGPEKQLFDLL